MNSDGLEYGAFDFVDFGGRWVFLEVNPAGMYGFVEIKSGLEVTATIVGRLCEPVASAGSAACTMAK